VCVYAVVFNYILITFLMPYVLCLVAGINFLIVVVVVVVIPRRFWSAKPYMRMHSGHLKADQSQMVANSQAKLQLDF